MPSRPGYTQIQISKEMAKLIRSKGVAGDTYETILRRLVRK